MMPPVPESLPFVLTNAPVHPGLFGCPSGGNAHSSRPFFGSLYVLNIDLEPAYGTALRTHSGCPFFELDSNTRRTSRPCSDINSFDSPTCKSVRWKPLDHCVRTK
jgi:hypothetical protein